MMTEENQKQKVMKQTQIVILVFDIVYPYRTTASLSELHLYLNSVMFIDPTWQMKCPLVSPKES